MKKMMGVLTILMFVAGISHAAELALTTAVSVSEEENAMAVGKASYLLETIMNYTPEDYPARYDQWIAMSTEGLKKTLQDYREKNVPPLVERGSHSSIVLDPKTAEVEIKPLWSRIDLVRVKIEGDVTRWTTSDPAKHTDHRYYTVDMEWHRDLPLEEQLQTGDVLIDTEKKVNR